MSIFNSKLNCIFIQVPRTASSSIAKIIGGQGHRSIIYFKRFFYGQSDLDFENTFKFGFVRDPYTRFVSCFSWYLENYPQKTDINDFALKLKEEYKTWEDDDLRALIFKPQWQFICNQYYQTQLDYVGRFENLKDDWKYIADKLGIIKKLSHENKSKNTHTLTSQSKEIIYELYEKDFLTFNYNRL